MKNETKDNLALFSAACRYNSGRHFLDSGGANGRHWQKPWQPKDAPAVTVDDYGATINTAHFLAEHLEVDLKIQKKFDGWARRPENKELSWFEAGEKYALEELRLEQLGRGNSYNEENDLSQVYVWEVYAREMKRDWLFADDDILTVIYVHTGADVRGGYSYPLFCRPRGEYSIPVDLCAEFVVIEERNTGKEPCDLHEEWLCGYYPYPWSQVMDDCKRMFFPDGREPDTFLAAHRDGGAVKVQAVFRECY